MEFKLNAPYQPTGDQPEAIRQLVEGIGKVIATRFYAAHRHGKTFTIANIIQQVQKPPW